MIDIPEILQQIASYLDTTSLLACTTVSRQWRIDFTPYFWRTFNNFQEPWYRLVESCSSDSSSSSCHAVGGAGRSTRERYKDRQDRLSNVMRVGQQYIRHLLVTREMVLIAALEAKLTGLLSLTLDSYTWEPDDDDGGSDGDDDVSNGDDSGNNGDDSGNNDVNDTRKIYSRMKALGSDSLWDISVPIAAFDGSSGGGSSLTLTRAFWRLVLLNPNLGRLCLERADIEDGIHSFSIQKKAGASPVLSSAGQDFLRGAFLGLWRLQHLEMGLDADNFLLCNLATLLPSLVSFVHVDRATFDPVVLQQAPAHSVLKDLKFREASMMPGELRAIVVAFPALTRLSINVPLCLLDSYDANLTKATTDRDILEHSSLKTLEIVGQPCIDILRCRVRFLRITELRHSVFVRNAQELQQLFWMFPALERYESMTSDDNATRPLRRDEGVRESRNYPIENLILHPADFLHPVWESAAFDLGSIIAQMPFLTQLWVCGVWDSGRIMIEVARNCKNIQEVVIDLKEGYTQGLIDLFVGCPNLRTCRGAGHAVLAEDLIESAEWVCVELRELDIGIVGVPRLTAAQEGLLKGISDLDAELLTFMNTNTLGNSNQEEPDTEDKIEQVRERLSNRGHELTADEAEAFEQLWISHMVQRKVYKRLARLTRLQELHFTLRETANKPRRMDTLEFTLESGLAELGALEGIKKLSYGNANRMVYSKETQWVSSRWSKSVLPMFPTCHRPPRFMVKAR
ncbi:hypothetical protein KI688_012861 [Linnemannia hyalina]|uniref:F-box domain-containing protein n=1 Tax=Linnemannia hyalina TaxID=64524 RepID=A0A9P7XTB8_9FUNG|nr:hypothetical protein KI688_012861 [Linnemannia hyalina]